MPLAIENPLMAAPLTLKSEALDPLITIEFTVIGLPPIFVRTKDSAAEPPTGTLPKFHCTFGETANKDGPEIGMLMFSKVRIAG